MEDDRRRAARSTAPPPSGGRPSPPREPPPAIRAARRARAPRRHSPQASASSLGASARRAVRHAALPSSGKTLAGLSRQVGIEDGAHAHLLGEFGVGELVAHQIALLDADAMLAGQAAAEFDAHSEHIHAGLLSFRLLRRIIDVVEDQRVHVAVAGVKDVGDPQPVGSADFADPPQRLGQPPGRHRAVHADIVGDAAGRAERRFTALPDLRAFHRRHRFAHDPDMIRPGDRGDAGELGRHFGVAPFDLDDQHRFDIERIAGMGEVSRRSRSPAGRDIPSPPAQCRRR